MQNRLSGKIHLAGRLRRFKLLGELPPQPKTNKIPGTNVAEVGILEYPNFEITIKPDEIRTFQTMLEEEHPEPKDYEVMFSDNASGRIRGAVIVGVYQEGKDARVEFYTMHIEKFPKNEHLWTICPLIPKHEGVRMCQLCGCLKVTTMVQRGRMIHITKYLLNGDVSTSSPDCNMGIAEAMRLKRFQLFCYGSHYPLGGMHDFVKDFDTLDAALDFQYQFPNEITHEEANGKGNGCLKYESWHIYDSVNNEVAAGYEYHMLDFERAKLKFPMLLPEYLQTIK